MGDLVHQNNDFYSGEFNKHNEKHVVGMYEFSESGNVYYGNWENGKMKGEGVMRFKSGDVYEGRFLENKFHGAGKYFFANGAELNGTFLEGSLDGFGIYKCDGQTWE